MYPYAQHQQHQQQPQHAQPVQHAQNVQHVQHVQHPQHLQHIQNQQHSQDQRGIYQQQQPIVSTSTALSTLAPLRRQDVDLDIRQQPKECLVLADGKEKARKPVDPPPIIQLGVNQNADPAQHFLQSPYLFMCASLYKHDKDESWDGHNANKALAGSLTSSLHRLKDVDNKDGAFFVFGDISIRVQGVFRLQFSLFDLRKESMSAEYLGSIISEPFRVMLPKDFKGMEESTYLSRAFSDQGVRLRLRKEPRAMMGQKRSYPYPSVDTPVSSTPLRPNMNDYTYGDEGPPTKRMRSDSNDRKNQYQDPSTATSSGYPVPLPVPFTSAFAPQLRQPSVSGMQSMPQYPTYGATSSSPYAGHYRSSLANSSNYFGTDSIIPNSVAGAVPGHLATPQRYTEMTPQQYAHMFSYPTQDAAGL